MGLFSKIKNLFKKDNEVIDDEKDEEELEEVDSDESDEEEIEEIELEIEKDDDTNEEDVENNAHE